MQKQKKPLRDFFSDYNQAKIRSSVLSVMFAALVSVGVVMVTQDVDTRGLMASVSNVANAKKYDADIILETRNGKALDIVVGSEIKSADSVSLTLLSDPEKFTSLASTDPRITITSPDPGAYMIKMALAGEDIYPGTTIATLTAKFDPSVSIGLVDTTFQSAGVSYNLTSKGK